jgi:copper chaperone CopZ
MALNIPTHLPTASLLVSNMHCPSCVESITQLLSGLSSVKNLSISLLLNRVTFAIDTSISSSTRAPSYRKIVDQVKGILATEGGFNVTEEAAPRLPPSLPSSPSLAASAAPPRRRSAPRSADPPPRALRGLPCRA